MSTKNVKQSVQEWLENEESNTGTDNTLWILGGMVIIGIIAVIFGPSLVTAVGNIGDRFVDASEKGDPTTWTP